jgi:DNA-binding transcriptional regulator YdaS (Cro superfamily)
MDATPFAEACRLIGPYAKIGALFDPPVSPQGVAKWARDGVPPERVLPIAAATDFAVRPHDLRPDLYPHPDDALPEQRRQGRAAA